MTMRRLSGDDEEQSSSRLSGGIVSAVSGVGLLAVFMIQNTADVNVTFLFWDFSMPVWLLTLSAAVLGALVWLGLGIPLGPGVETWYEISAEPVVP